MYFPDKKNLLIVLRENGGEVATFLQVRVMVIGICGIRHLLWPR